MFTSLLHNRLLMCATVALILSACGEDKAAAPQAIKSQPSSATSAPVQTAAAQTPLERGATLYKRCQSCHTLEQDGAHKVGPNMWGLYGSTAGSKEGFAYSKVMSESDLVWTDETLNAYIENPRKFLPGNRMSYVGLRKAEDREAVIAYIKAETTPK